MKRFVMLLAVTLVTTGFCFAAEDFKRYAILVGVNDYLDSSIVPLKTPRNDARDIAGSLRDAGWDKVFVLTDDADARSEDFPTRRNIEKRINLLAELAQPKDLIVLFFSGHGVAATNGDAFLPVDADLSRLADTSLGIRSMVAAFQKQGIAKIVLMVDACRESITTTKGLSVVGVGGKDASQGIAAIALYSTKAGWYSYEDKAGRNSVFTKFLLEGLRGSAKTLGDLVSWVPEAVGSYALDAGIRQKPVTQLNDQSLSGIPVQRVSSAAATVPAVIPVAKSVPAKMAPSFSTPKVDPSIAKLSADERRFRYQKLILEGDKNFQAKQTEQASAKYLEALKYQYTSEAVLLLTRTFDMQGRTGEKAAILESYIAVHGPNHGDILAGLAHAYLVLGRNFDTALWAADQAVALDSSVPWYWQVKGGVEIKLGAWDDCIRSTSRAIGLAPATEVSYAWHDRGYSHYMKGELAQAYKDLTTAAEAFDSLDNREAAADSRALAEKCKTASVNPNRDYLFKSGTGLAPIVGMLTNYGSGTKLSSLDQSDAVYKPCIRMTSAAGGWGNGTGASLSFDNIAMIPTKAFTALVFKFKSKEFTQVSFIINHDKGYNACSLYDFAAPLSDGWLQVRIPFSEMAIGRFPETISHFFLGFGSRDGSAVGTAQITDIGFIP